MPPDDTASRLAPPVLRLADFDAMLFDLDGVVTHTPHVHAAAWKDMFDDFLGEYKERHGVVVAPFDPEADYVTHVDGLERNEGIRSFLLSRGIRLPYGTPRDPETAETICAIGSRKNDYFKRHLALHGVEVFESTLDLIRRLRAAGQKIAVVSASRSSDAIMRKAGVLRLFDLRLGGVEIKAMGLNGKPAADPFLKAAELLGVPPQRTAVFEDSIAGVQSGRAAGAGLVVGIDRRKDPDALIRAGADVIVTDLAELRVE